MKSLLFLLRQRGYVLLALLTLILSIGANLVVFSVVNALWLRPLPVKDPSRVVMVMGDTAASGGAENFWMAERGLQDVRDLRVFAQVAGQVMTSDSNVGLRPNITLEAVAHPIETLGVTSEYFGVLGLGVRGRDFTKDDDRYGAPPVAIISDRLWRTRFRSDGGLIGRVIPATPRPLQIIGIAPSGFLGARRGEQADLWIPRNLVASVSAVPTRPDGTPGLPEGSAGMLAIARLNARVSLADAQRALDDTPGNRRNRGLFHQVVVPLSSLFGTPDHRTLIVSEGPVLRVIGITAILVLLGGCATLMALVLVHYERRRQEFAIRLAIGASRGRLSRRLAGELAWMVIIGCGGALVIAAWSLRALPALDLPGGVNLGRLDLTLDWHVAAAAIAAAAATVVLAACVPLVRFTSNDVARSLISPTGTASAESLRIRKTMLAIHVAATVMVLVAASLFVRTIQYGFNRGPGFDIDHTLFVSVDVTTPYDLSASVPSGSSFDAIDAAQKALAETRRSRSQQVIDAVGRISSEGIVSEGMAPIGVDAAAQFAQPKTVFADSRQHELRLARAWIGPGYFTRIGVPVIAGRDLTDPDVRTGTSAPVIITASVAAKLWPETSPLGQHVHLGSPGETDYEVVGVVQDFSFGSLRFDTPAAIFLARNSRVKASNTLQLVLRDENPSDIIDQLKTAIAGVVPRSPRIAIDTGRDLVARDLGRERLGAWFFSGFGIVAVAIGLGGVFGLIAYLAESRRREFGIRIALGATSANLLNVALGTGLLPVIVGTGAGLVGAAWIAKTAESFLIGVSALDVVSYAGVAIMLITGAAAAGLAAAWRVRRISPIEALRAE